VLDPDTHIAPPDPDPRGTEVEQALSWWRSKAQLVASVVSLAGLLGGGAFSWVHWGLRPTACVAALVFATVQIPNSYLRRRKLHHWDIENLERSLALEILLGCVFPLALGTLILLGCLPPPVATALAVVACVGVIVLVPVELGIAAAVIDAEKLSVSRYIANCTWLSKRLRRDRQSVEEVLRNGESARLFPPLSWLFNPIFGSPVSGARYVMMLGLLVATVVLATGVDRSEVPKTSDEASAGELAGGSGSAKDEHRDSGTDGASRSSTTPATPGGMAQPSSSPDVCSSEPGAGTPESMRWMREDFAMLIRGVPGSERRLDATLPPGMSGSCTHLVTATQKRGSFSYTTQEDLAEHRVASIAVDSLAWGPAIFVFPAVKPVQALITRYGALGGSPRLYAGQGDFYLVRVEQGTVVLVRRQFTQASGLTEPFTELPLAVAAAWLEQMRLHDGWLWPIEAVNDDGTRTYRLVEYAVSDGSESTLSIEYDPVNQSARSEVDGVPQDFGPDGAWLDEVELQVFAESAR